MTQRDLRYVTTAHVRALMGHEKRLALLSASDPPIQRRTFRSPDDEETLDTSCHCLVDAEHPGTYLGTVTTVFVLLVVGGFVALTQLSGQDEEVRDKCEQATTVKPVA